MKQTNRSLATKETIPSWGKTASRQPVLTILVPALLKAGKTGVNIRELAVSSGCSFGAMTTWLHLKGKGLTKRTATDNFRVAPGKQAELKALLSAKKPAVVKQAVAVKKTPKKAPETPKEQFITITFPIKKGQIFTINGRAFRG